MYTVGCPFCAAPVFSQFWEDVEAHILSCYDTLSPKDKGKPWFADVPEPSLCEGKVMVFMEDLGKDD